MYIFVVYTLEKKINTAKIFRSGNSQTIRLPKEYRFNQDEVYITKVGDSILLISQNEKRLNLMASLEHFTDDFMTERKQPKFEDREKL